MSKIDEAVKILLASSGFRARTKLGVCPSNTPLSFEIGERWSHRSFRNSAISGYSDTLLGDWVTTGT